MSRILYFAYGSNLNPKRIARRCPSVITFGAAKLKNYAIAERLYADIDHRSGSVVPGVLYSISEEDLLALDAFEGTPKIYRRIWIEAECHGENFPAVTYQMTLATKRIRASLPYPDEYRKICATGAIFHHIQNKFARKPTRSIA